MMRFRSAANAAASSACLAEAEAEMRVRFSFSVIVLVAPFSREGRKNGAFSGALGASFGVLRWRITSRFSSVCQRVLGMSDMVSSLSLSWSAVV